MSGKGKKGIQIRPEDIQTVQNLIERCLQLYMNQSEAIAVLKVQAQVEPGLTSLVWKKLEQQNPDFFEAYQLRLRIKDQVNQYNALVQKQLEMMKERGVNLEVESVTLEELAQNPPVMGGAEAVPPTPVPPTPISFEQMMQCLVSPPPAKATAGSSSMPPTSQPSGDDNPFGGIDLLSPIGGQFDPGSFLVSPMRQSLMSPLRSADIGQFPPS